MRKILKDQLRLVSSFFLFPFTSLLKIVKGYKIAIEE